MSKTNALVSLLVEKLGLHADEGLQDQAEYILSIPDLDDVKEWLHSIVSPEYEIFLDDVIVSIDSIRRQAVVVAAAPAASNRQRGGKVVLYNDTQDDDVVDVNEPVAASRIVFRRKVIIQLPPRAKVSRSTCNCIGKTGHEIIGNCLSCGRIICQIEDYGDCLFCGAIAIGVWPPQISWLIRNGVIEEEIVIENEDEEEGKAIGQKNRLIQYDREGTRRTQIFDDSTDWFSETTDVWKGRDEREQARIRMEEFEQKKIEAKREFKISLDFQTGGFQLVSDKATAVACVESQSRDVLNNFIAPPLQPPPETRSNVLSETQEEILGIIREKLGVTKKSVKAAAEQPVSIFSFLDDDMNLALD